MPSLNRIVMARSSRAMIRELDPPKLKVAEISGWWGKMFDFGSYEQFNYPEYDVCAAPFLDDDGKIRQFDLILANQVWEHLDRPYEATLNVHEMLRPGGHFWLAVPFFVPFHAAPMDCSRWSARGLKNFLVECGFAPDAIRAEQWGNKQAALRNLEDRWPPQYDPETDSLENDPNMPICSWAMAQKI
ncbi:methyltransferase domain-containing protein [Tropicibacter sp. R16_0]|uniref:class I SAM-dependent methyltransferase n=1 Tax=Tropicibacter sp. R16_0 TaxID=2821102 RepID=UPI001ADC6321|nr:methyltransferase domain-containing protein [Tropicibacter sp. R16_0]MBO9452684.1 methyltransferase domain-containing protein [Tropicibacter sp. R16_0]